jgi:glycosyltransferase involved in cell wall biosynthesis
VRIGLTRYLPRDEWVSLEWVFKTLESALQRRHEVVYLPLDFHYSSKQKRLAIAEQFVQECDVNIGVGIPEILAARQQLGKVFPCLIYGLGNLARGGKYMTAYTRYLTTNDVLLGNCVGDIEMAQRFFSNIRAWLVPFAYDENLFYPLDIIEVRQKKQALGFKEEDKIILYSGRVFLEKNVQLLLRLFGIISQLIPGCHFVVAGGISDTPFRQFGLQTVDMHRTIDRIITQLNLPLDRVHFLDWVGPDQLRDLYNISNVAVNTTLHHDENFGYSQVEAMACGTPVVGTCWGGLKDTILDGQTGYHVSTTLTPLGVKVDWWEALNRIVLLLNDDEQRHQLSVHCTAHVRAKYSIDAVAERIEMILQAVTTLNNESAKPLQLSKLGTEIMEESRSTILGGLLDPQFQHGPQSFSLYRTLIRPYTGITKRGIAPDKLLELSDTIILASPVVQPNDMVISVNDPLFPFEISIPELYQHSLRVILDILRERPIATIKQLDSLGLNDAGLLLWMIKVGLLLRVSTEHSCLPLSSIGHQMSEPLFSMRKVACDSDVIIFHSYDGWSIRDAGM